MICRENKHKRLTNVHYFKMNTEILQSVPLPYSSVNLSIFALARVLTAKKKIRVNLMIRTFLHSVKWPRKNVNRPNAYWSTLFTQGRDLNIVCLQHTSIQVRILITKNNPQKIAR